MKLRTQEDSEKILRLAQSCAAIRSARHNERRLNSFRARTPFAARARARETTKSDVTTQ